MQEKKKRDKIKGTCLKTEQPVPTRYKHDILGKKAKETDLQQESLCRRKYILREKLKTDQGKHF